MSEFRFEYKDLLKYGMDLTEMNKRTSDRMKKAFLRKEGSKLLRRTKNAIRSSGIDISTHEKKTYYMKKIGSYKPYGDSPKRGKPYVYHDAMAIRVYSSSPHAHLLEYGHKMVGHKGGNLKVSKRTRAFQPFVQGKELMEQVYYSDCIKWFEENYRELW
ncbi:MAG: hypothetical protein Q4F79_07475 [Eubacteriales bacterium]|nr:hypothetical protein [Eubacteriales bacterium]